MVPGMLRHALVTLVLLATFVARASDVLSAQDREQLLAIAVAGDAAWNARSADGLAATFTADGQNTILGTPLDLRGRDAIRSYFATSLPKTDPALRHRTVVDELTPIGANVVIAGGRVWIERLNADGTLTPVKRFTITSALVRENGAWRIRVNRVHPEEKV